MGMDESPSTKPFYSLFFIPLNFKKIFFIWLLPEFNSILVEIEKLSHHSNDYFPFSFFCANSKREF